MIGHEGVKDAVLGVLAASVPVRLAALRAELEVDSPADPAFLFGDSLAVATTYPVLMVRSTESPRMQHAGGQEWLARYSLEVIVAASSATHGSYDAAARDRDRLMLAAREALLGATVHGGVAFDVRAIVEATGASAEVLTGNPVAAGSLEFAVSVTEVLAPPAALESVAVADLGVSVLDRNQSIP